MLLLANFITAIGGFKVSFITDNIQGAMVVGLIILGVITVGVETHIDRSLIDQSGLLKSSLLGWQLVYILPVAILTNDFFISVGAIFHSCFSIGLAKYLHRASGSEPSPRVPTKIFGSAFL
jgi:Na+/pantothenate symporter